MMNKVIRTAINNSLIISFLVILGGCSISEPDKASSYQKSSARVVPQRSVVRPSPVKPKVVPRKIPRRVVKPYKPQIKRYNDSKPVVRVLTKEEQEAFNKTLIRLEKEKREVKYDPYASIPDSSSSSTITSSKPSSPIVKSSSAVKSLILQARAEMLIGKHESAESKLERGLRIEPENPKLWALLAQAYYAQSNYSQSIDMAKKAIQFSRDDDFIAKNWRLVKKSGEKSGDAGAVKDALDYSKVNP